ERFSKHFGGAESGEHSAGGESSNRSGGAESGKHSPGGEPGKQSAGGEPGKQSAGGAPGKQSAGGAPGIEVSGRMDPVEVRYRPLADPDRPGDEPKDQAQGICDALGELRAEGRGDVLVFLSGEREIRDTADALAEQADLAGLEVLPLYGRLAAAQQHRAFEPHQPPPVPPATH